MIFPAKRIAFVSLGCKVNFAETSTWARIFVDHGYERVDEGALADLYIVNTCSVTEQADKKCRQTIRHIHRIAPLSKIMVTGCYAQLKAKELLAMEGVALVVGAAFKSNLFNLTETLLQRGEGGCFYTPIEEVTTLFPACSCGDRTRSFLKIQDGCDYHCSYCTVPLARGHSRNVPIDQVLHQAKELATLGIKEVVLTGVNTGDYGKSGGASFLDLLKALSLVEGIRRWRISSIEPNLITPDIVHWMAQTPSFLPHFHLPLQSGSNEILSKMRRRYNRELFSDRVKLIRSVKPLAFIGVDVIVGFPSENEAAFMETYHFLEFLAPSFLHIFPYSRRPGTPAASFPLQVPQEEKRERANRLLQLSNRLYEAFAQQNSGREEEVLFEAKERAGLMSGFTRNYLKVERPFQKELIGEIVTLTLDNPFHKDHHF